MAVVCQVVRIGIILSEAVRIFILYASFATLKKLPRAIQIGLLTLYPVVNYILNITGCDSNLKLLILIVLNLFVAKMLFDISLGTAFMYDILFFAVVVLCDCLVMGIMMFLNPGFDFGIFKIDYFIGYQTEILAQVLNYLVIIFFIRRRGKEEERYSLLETGIFLLEGMVTVVSLCIVVEFTYYRVIEYEIVPMVFLLWTVGLFATQVGFFIMFEQYVQGKHKEKELLEVQSYMETQFAHYKHMMERREELQKIWHDIKNVLAAYQIAGEQHEEELQHYLQDVMKGPEELIIETGTPVANAILYDKGKVAKEKRITFEAGVEPEAFSFMENVDICILLSNLLDNAIEACEKCEGNRWICIEAKRKGEYLILNVDNSKANKIRKKNGVMITSKKEKNQHGYGWKNIESVIKKYEGTKNISDSSHEFHVTIMLNTSFTK